MTRFKIFIAAATLSTLMCCAGGGSNSASKATTTAQATAQAPQPKLIERISSPFTYMVGDTITINLELNDEVDSAFLFIDNKPATLKNNTYKFVADRNTPLGKTSFRFDVYKGGIKESRLSSYVLIARDAPKQYRYKTINSYPHNTKHYTQGLIYAQGTIYEGTGINGESMLAQVDLMSGKKVRSTDLDATHFGEGITLLNNKLYQLTWQSGKAFVYDVNSFKAVDEFSYNGEGWGITTDGKVLYMSDGSNKITVRDPEDFSVLRTISVYTEKGELEYLNELEWIDGQIWANVYTTDYIVRINPATGLVEGVIDLSGILPTSERTPETDVLNGIAYDQSGKRIFVTGKNWSKMFQIEVY